MRRRLRLRRRHRRPSVRIHFARWASDGIDGGGKQLWGIRDADAELNGTAAEQGASSTPSGAHWSSVHTGHVYAAVSHATTRASGTGGAALAWSEMAARTTI
jgi:hypothetical protein